VVRVVFNTEPNPPIVYGSGTAIDADKPSLIVDLLRMVGPRLGVEFQFRRVPWQRGLFLVETGQADAIFAASYNEDRGRYGAFPMKDGHPDASRRIHQQSYSLFVRPGSAVRFDGRGISGLTQAVGVQGGFAVIGHLEAMGVALDREPSPRNNLLKLVAGRIDAYAEIDTLAEAAMWAEPGFAAQVVKLDPPLRSTPYFLMVSKIFQQAHPELTERIWDAIADVRGTEAYRDLLTGKYAD
jgi:polar amino acid transport system substrate-binding protein